MPTKHCWAGCALPKDHDGAGDPARCRSASGMTIQAQNEAHDAMVCHRDEDSSTTFCVCGSNFYGTDGWSAQSIQPWIEEHAPHMAAKVVERARAKSVVELTAEVVRCARAWKAATWLAQVAELEKAEAR